MLLGAEVEGESPGCPSFERARHRSGSSVNRARLLVELPAEPRLGAEERALELQAEVQPLLAEPSWEAGPLPAER